VTQDFEIREVDGEEFKVCPVFFLLRCLIYNLAHTHADSVLVMVVVHPKPLPLR
jgi:hypothetical protein